VDFHALFCSALAAIFKIWAYNYSASVKGLGGTIILRRGLTAFAAICAYNYSAIVKVLGRKILRGDLTAFIISCAYNYSASVKVLCGTTFLGGGLNAILAICACNCSAIDKGFGYRTLSDGSTDIGSGLGCESDIGRSTGCGYGSGFGSTGCSPTGTDFYFA